MITIDTDKCIRLADHYGFLRQLQTLSDECIELSAAAEDYLADPRNNRRKEDFMQELADVLIVCEQMKSLVSSDALQPWIDFKTARQMLRVHLKQPALAALPHDGQSVLLLDDDEIRQVKRGLRSVPDADGLLEDLKKRFPTDDDGEEEEPEGTHVQAEALRIAEIARAIATREPAAFPVEQRDAAIGSLCKAVDDLQNAALEDDEANHG